MSVWISIVIAGLVNYLSRLVSVLVINPKKMSERTKKILNYVPSAVFPAIIFPAIFLDNTGTPQFEDNPKILAATIAFVVGILSRNILATIFSGLISYWFIIFIL